MSRAGRPLKYQSVDEIIPIIDKYFNSTPIDEWTITGLALALDTSRTTLIDYERYGEDGKIDIAFTDTIKKAKDMVEHSYEIDLKKKGNTGTIFALKNFDWKDKSEVENTLTVTPIGKDTPVEELQKIINGS